MTSHLKMAYEQRYIETFRQIWDLLENAPPPINDLLEHNNIILEIEAILKDNEHLWKEGY